MSTARQSPEGPERTSALGAPNAGVRNGREDSWVPGSQASSHAEHLRRSGDVGVNATAGSRSVEGPGAAGQAKATGRVRRSARRGCANQQRLVGTFGGVSCRSWRRAELNQTVRLPYGFCPVLRLAGLSPAWGENLNPRICHRWLLRAPHVLAVPIATCGPSSNQKITFQ